MRWVTREGAKVDRVACPWLIKKFIDKDAEFLFVPEKEVLAVAKRVSGKSFDAPGADYTHRQTSDSEICSFESLIQEAGSRIPRLRRALCLLQVKGPQHALIYA